MVISRFQSFDFLGYTFRPRKAIWHGTPIPLCGADQMAGTILPLPFKSNLPCCRVPRPHGVMQTGFPVRSGDPAFPSRPGAAQAAARSGGDWEQRSHPQPRTARCCARAWRGWRAPDLPRSEHRGTLPPVEDRASTYPLRSVTSRNRRHAYFVSSVERCLPRYHSSGCRPKHHPVRQHMAPRFHPAL